MSGSSTDVASVAPAGESAFDQGQQPVLELEAGSASRREWLASLWNHRGVIRVLARKDFHSRYKRASFGVLWALALPLLQAAVMIVVFSHLVHTGKGVSYGAFVLSGILAWGYLAIVLPQATTSIVDGTSLTDKLWFPRAILPLVPCFSNLVTLGISMIILLIGAPLLGAPPTAHLVLLIPACLLLILFTMALTMVLSALQVYFRDVRFIVSAALLVWLYATPIMYPASKLGSLGQWLALNPMTGVISLFHVAVLGDHESLMPALLVSLVATAALLLAAVEIHRRHDRLFVDLL